MVHPGGWAASAEGAYALNMPIKDRAFDWI
jgi:hypothetical protein